MASLSVHDRCAVERILRLRTIQVAAESFSWQQGVIHCHRVVEAPQRHRENPGLTEKEFFFYRIYVYC